MFQTIVNADGTISIVPVGQTNNLPFTSMATMDAANQFPILPGSSTLPLDAFKNTVAPMGVNTGIMSSSSAIPFGTPVDIAQGFTKNTPSDTGTNFQFLPSANEANETDEVKETKTGIAKLFDFLTNFIPGVGLLKRLGDVPGGIRSLNQRLRNTDFGQSRTGAEYMMRRRERKQAERAQKAMPDVYRSAREQGFTNDRGGFSTSRADRAGTSLGSGQFSSKSSTGRQGY